MTTEKKETYTPGPYLIAAAPELLEVLKLCVDELRPRRGDDKKTYEILQLVERTRSLIARVEGQS